jgi:hypothetical protein
MVLRTMFRMVLRTMFRAAMRSTGPETCLGTCGHILGKAACLPDTYLGDA